MKCAFLSAVDLRGSSKMHRAVPQPATLVEKVTPNLEGGGQAVQAI